MTSQSWWAAKLGGQPVPQAPAYQPLPAPQRTSYPPIAPIPQQTPQDVSAAQQAASQTRYAKPSSCPECGGGNYAKVGVGSSEHGSFDVYRCYDCGYPLQQSGSGAVGSNSGPATPAQQVSKVNNFNPAQIVGRIG